ncbi:hypothetical protein [Pedobacter gandavensis]|uniref:hypothetical protein n=1 Tax=Pedobacter gandavensis TaxID=2679963 RepID=UPI0029313C7C|nr:hypothetical protein [Pedobacter gandavensis]
MILPNNGKVIVFDDKIEDVHKLLSLLSKEKIAYLYYHDEYGNDLPAEPVENVRLVFLDLELVTNGSNSKNIIAPIAQRLKTSLVPNNLYILIYWSTKENKYREELEREFENGLKDYKPLKILTLDKAKANDEDGFSYIRAELIKGIKQFSALTSFLFWESSVNNAAGSITNQICSIFFRDDKWDTNMSGLLYQLAKGQAGSDAIKGLDKFQLLELAADVFNANLVESVEKKFQSVLRSINLEEIKQSGSGMSTDEKNNLHTKIHLLYSSSGFNHFYPGNLYIMDINAIGKEIIQRNLKEDSKKTLNKQNTRLVCIDLTPACDYAQEKNYSRMAYGVLFPKEISKKNLKGGDFRYDACPLMKFDDYSFLLIDFRCVRSFTKDEFLFKFSEQTKYRLRSSLLLDIEAQLANHVNRPGIITF